MHNLLGIVFNCISCGTLYREGTLANYADVRVFCCPNRQCRRWFTIRCGSFFVSNMSMPNLLKFISGVWEDCDMWTYSISFLLELVPGGHWLTGATSCVMSVPLICRIDHQSAESVTLLKSTSVYSLSERTTKDIHVPGQWLLSDIDRHTGKCFLQTVPQRDAATLILIIQALILNNHHDRSVVGLPDIAELQLCALHC